MEEKNVTSSAASEEEYRASSYDIFNGVTLTYINMRAAQHLNLLPEGRNIVKIDYCHEGCMDYTMNDKTIMLGAGDVLVHQRIRSLCKTNSSINHFCGISITINLPYATDGMEHMLADLRIDLNALKEKYCNGEQMTLIRRSSSLIPIFSALYSVPEHIRCNYAKTKMPELIFLLDHLRPDDRSDSGQRIFSMYAVAQTKAVGHYLTQNIEAQTTIASLSKQFCISQTVLKECFKRMYGESIAAFSRRMRMKKASELLLATDMNILDIAMQVGYMNASKFAVAFHSVFGCNPKDYRKKMD